MVEGGTLPNLERLRTFALLSALVLICYSAAGVSLEPGARISVLGIPFLVSNPDLLPLGLICLSSYGLLRFYYYGFMLFQSPFRQRAELLRQLHLEGNQKRTWLTVFWGATEFSSSFQKTDYSEAEGDLRRVLDAFPKLGNIQAKGILRSNHGVDEEGDEYTSWGIDFTIPVRVRIAAIVQDIDYAAPVWLSIVALTFAAGRAMVS